MKPIPSSSGSERPKPVVSQLPTVPSVVSPPPAAYSATNRKLTSPGTSRWYAVLLVLSLSVASLFCWLYMTKPVVVAGGAFPVPTNHRHEAMGSGGSLNGAQPQTGSLLPAGDRLPGDTSTKSPASAQESHYALPAPSIGEFEETNLRMQHILTAASDHGDVSRLVVDVPVLYRSRNMRWTPEEIAQARRLLIQLGDYQEKSQALRGEGVALLEDWNQLVERSLPLEGLRADSPSLPTNQDDASTGPRAANLDTMKSIHATPEP